MEWSQFSLKRFLINALKIAIAFVLAFPIAWEREKSTRIMGLQTFSLVAIASCGYVLIALGFIAPEADNAQARILQG